MTMRMVVMAMVLLAGGMPLAARAAGEDTLEAKSLPIIEKAFVALNASDPQRAVDLAEPVIADFEKAYAGVRRIYCADTSSESGVYALAPASEGGESTQPKADPAKPDSTGATIIVHSIWCDAQYVRAFALVDLGRFDEAQGGFERLIKFAPRRSRYLNELGFLFQRKRQFPASIALYVRADASADLLEPADRDRERCVALRGQGFGLIELGQWDEAQAAFEKCLKITPGEPKSLNELEYIRQQRRKRA